MTSIRPRPALLFLSPAGVNTTASISARKLSNDTTRSIISSGSPIAEIAAVEKAELSHRPPANLAITIQTRTNRWKPLIFRGALRSIALAGRIAGVVPL
jgi:hypothetical protein